MDARFETYRLKNEDKEGFTLLEVVIALMVIGISMGVLFQSLSRSKQLSWKSDETVIAVAMARNLFSERSLMAQALEMGEISGKSPEAEEWLYTMGSNDLENIEVNESLESIKMPDHIKVIRLCLTRETGFSEKSYCFEKWLSL